MTLEQAIAYIEDDELVEVTPKSIRIRKSRWIRTSASVSRARGGLGPFHIDPSCLAYIRSTIRLGSVWTIMFCSGSGVTV